MTSTSSNPCTPRSSDSCTRSGHRCRVCQHLRCPICGPRAMKRIRHSRREGRLPKAVRKLIGKVPCCKCALRNSKLGRFDDFDPKQREKFAFIKYSNFRKAALVRIRLRNALKQKTHRSVSQTSCKIRLGLEYDSQDPKDPGAGPTSLVVVRCGIPNDYDNDNDDDNSIRNLHRLELAIRQMYKYVRRFIVLLSEPRGRVIGNLSYMLYDLLSQLADLNHRVYNSLAPGIPSKTHGLRQARGHVQAAYKALCSTAYKSGLLARSARKFSTTRVGLQIVWKKAKSNGQCAQTVIVQLRLRLMELSDSLHAWVLLLRAWRSL